MRMLALASSLLVVCCAKQESYSDAHSDSGITGPAYAKIVDELSNLEREHPVDAKVISYGQSLGGRPLTMIRIGREGSLSGDAKRPSVLIAGTIHGDEFLGIENRLPRWILENRKANPSGGVARFLDGGGIIYVAPILNPDGYEARRRENNRGKDLNRDFDLRRAQKAGFTQPETKGLVDTIKREMQANSLKMKLTMDYHCCVGALIYPWGHSESEELPAAEKLEHKRLAKLMLAPFPGYGAGRAIEVVGYTALGASDDFYFETFGARAFTFEGAEGREDQNFDKHQIMWDRILADQAESVVQPNTGGSGTVESPYLAISRDDGRGSLDLWLSTRDAPKVALCKGSPIQCLGTSPSILARGGNGRRLGDLLIFTCDKAVSVTSGDQLTILAQDESGKTVASRAVRFEAR